eukprot:CAMPEP_0179039278 /NCGR_PEP_ID=MMETSP0796-20121207/15061_1 /TAXON_ID=73915 /ORGANISM="Pyrodinium bahamense, Strain pbaha01" /LENGTH=100 /DNA_ID=CAMNT_0020735611 /DNA_START=11 /DNA_END=309 /DNA_ORIENTATION=-
MTGLLASRSAAAVATGPRHADLTVVLIAPTTDLKVSRIVAGPEQLVNVHRIRGLIPQHASTILCNVKFPQKLQSRSRLPRNQKASYLVLKCRPPPGVPVA